MAMPSLLLPPDPRRPELAAFWTVVSLLAGAAATLLLVVLDAPAAWGVGVALTALLAASEVVGPGVARRIYPVWNRWAGRYRRLTREVVLRVCHALVFTLAGLGGSRMPSGRPPFGRSGWRERGTTPADAYASAGAEPADERSGRGRLREMLAWCRRSGNVWAATLLPYLWLLDALETKRDEQPPADIYTLY